MSIIGEVCKEGVGRGVRGVRYFWVKITIRFQSFVL